MACRSANQESHTGRTRGPAVDDADVEGFDTRTSLLAINLSRVEYRASPSEQPSRLR